MLISRVQVYGDNELKDVRCGSGVITEVGVSLKPHANELMIAGQGGALLPGLHDHHLHLFALAALCNSVQCSPDAVSGLADFARVLRACKGSGWVRGVGYHESVAGNLDRWVLDGITCERPVKIQHRSGKMWVVNSAGAELLALDEHRGLPGLELDARGVPTGRLFRLDTWMREQLAGAGPADMPDLSQVSALLASFGVTGVTDTTPQNNALSMEQFAAAAAQGQLLQTVRVMGGDDLPEPQCAQLQRGERKIMLDEDTLPHWNVLHQIVLCAHQQDRGVAVHCVTPAELVFTLSMLREVGVHPGDRIEHASLIPPDVIPLLQEVGVRVVTQPGFVAERGDQYLQEVAREDHHHLYRGQSLLRAGVLLAGSTDAPYGRADPWLAMRAAVDRRSPGGEPIGGDETLSPEQALALFTSAADDPGGLSRTIAVGKPADLCLLSCPWALARGRLRSDDVRATISRGELIYHAVPKARFNAPAAA